MELPLVKSARVLKLYPDNLVIAIEEREPYALWQRDGKVAVIAADGTSSTNSTTTAFLACHSWSRRRREAAARI